MGKGHMGDTAADTELNTNAERDMVVAAVVAVVFGDTRTETVRTETVPETGWGAEKRREEVEVKLEVKVKQADCVQEAGWCLYWVMPGMRQDG